MKWVCMSSFYVYVTEALLNHWQDRKLGLEMLAASESFVRCVNLRIFINV